MAPGPAEGASRTRVGALASGRNKVLAGGAGLLAVVAVAGVLLAPKLFGGPSDPGCKAYASTALPAYNKAIDDLNAQAGAKTLEADMVTATSDLSSAALESRSPAATSALDGLLAQLKAVRADVAQGSVPGKAVTALNNASAAADRAC